MAKKDVQKAISLSLSSIKKSKSIEVSQQFGNEELVAKINYLDSCVSSIQSLFGISFDENGNIVSEDYSSHEHELIAHNHNYIDTVYNIADDENNQTTKQTI